MANTEVTKGYVLSDKYIQSIQDYSAKSSTLQWDKQSVYSKLRDSDKFVIGSLILMYDYQTDSEKVAGSTIEHNGVGFNAFDALVLTDIVKTSLETKLITIKQVYKVRNYLYKYSNQIARILNERRA